MKRALLILLVLALCSFSLGQKNKNGGMECDDPIEVDPRDQALWVTTGNTGTSAHSACGIKNDKWFSVVSPCSNLIQFNLCQSKYDTVLAIYDDNTGEGCVNGEVNTDKFLTCNDDAPTACGTAGASGQSFLAYPSKFGQRFLIRVGGFRGSSRSYGEGILYVNCSGEATLETEELQIPSVGAAGSTTKLVVKPAGYKNSVKSFDFYSYDGFNYSKLVASEAPYALDTGEVRSRGSFIVDGETLNWESTSFFDELHTYRTSFQVSSDTRIPALTKIFGVLDLNVDDNPKELVILDQNPLESGQSVLLWEKRGLFFGYQTNEYSGVVFDGWRLQKTSQPFEPTFSPNGSITVSTYNSSKSYFPSDYSVWGQSDNLVGLSIQLNPTDDDGITNVNFGFFLSPTVYADDRSFKLFQGDNVTGNVLEKSVTFGHPTTVQVHQHTGNSSGNRFVIDPATGDFTYVANTFYEGSDTVTYVLINNDTPLDRSVGVLTFEVKVDDRPRPFPDFYNTSEQAELYVNASLGVLANDLPVKNPNKPALVHIKGHTNTTNGTLTFNEKDGSFTYRPYRHFNGVDTFQYTLKNNAGDSATANVTITVASVDFPPIAGNDTFTVNEDSVLNATIWDNDVEQEGSGYVIAVLVSYPAGGNSSFTWDNGTFVYTPPADFNGNTSFVYYLDNGVALSENATVNITVLAVNDPPIANPSTFILLEDTPFVGDASRNDQDKDGDTLTYSVLVPPAQSQEFTLYENGTFAYTPLPNFQGNDSFVYQVQDPSGEVANATVVLVIVNENDAPVAVDDYYHVMEGGSKIVADLQGVLANDTDVDHNTTLVAILDTTVLHGVLNLNSNGSFEYIPNEYYFGVDKFTYRATDGNRTSDIAVVTFNVTSVPNPPIANPDNYTIYEDSPLVITDYDHGVLANDFDPDGDFITARLLNKTSNALVTMYSNGTFVYRPRKNFNGQDTFFYNVSDGYSWTPGRVTVRILSVNDLPVPHPDYYTTNMDTRLVVDADNGVLKNDSDPVEREPLQIKGYTQPGNGSVTLYNNGSFVYTPKTGFVGTDKFNYTIADASGGRANTTVTIDVVKTKSVALIVIIIIVVIAGILVAIYFVRRRRSHEDLPDGQTPQRLFS